MLIIYKQGCIGQRKRAAISYEIAALISFLLDTKSCEMLGTTFYLS